MRIYSSFICTYNLIAISYPVVLTPVFLKSVLKGICHTHIVVLRKIVHGVVPFFIPLPLSVASLFPARLTHLDIAITFAMVFRYRFSLLTG